MKKLVNPANFINDNTVKKEEKQTSITPIINLDFFTGTDKPSLPIGGESFESTHSKRKSTRKKASTKKMPDGNTIVTDDGSSDSSLPMYQTNEPYIDTYSETTNMLKKSVVQMDVLTNDIKEQLDYIKASKTLKRKYDYLGNLASTASALISSKVGAIREINKTITDCHNLELKRIKDLKMDAANEKDDDKRIQDLYTAFVSTPVGTYNPMNPPSGAQLNFPTAAANTNAIPIVGTSNEDQGYNNYLNNLSPSQNLMLMENNPNIKTVVKYDKVTGARWFDVIDTSTGESVPNVPKPDEMFLEKIAIDENMKIARDVNLDRTYPLIVLNSNSKLSEY